LGTLAAGVAHEINNPLAIINDAVGWLKLVLQKDELAEMPLKQDFVKGLDTIARSVQRAKKITHQLLGFARKRDAATSAVDVRELVEEAVQMLRKEASYKEIEVVQESNPSLETIWTDPYQLRQVLINLLTNAIHATEPKGKITITSEGTKDGMALTIKDTGCGIPKENLDRIFEPFFSTKAPGEGTGLGLFVSRGIIEKLGGTLEVDSQLGRGSSFHIRLRKLPEPKDEIDHNEGVDWLERVRDMGRQPLRPGEDEEDES
jgi:signal transduction histidine kinase